MAPSSPAPPPRPTATRAGLWLLVTFAALAAVGLFVDLAPRVGADFFFATDDPQLRASQEIEQRFPSREQIVVRVGGKDIQSAEYARAVGALTTDLLALPGVSGVRSLTQGPFSPGDTFQSPLWKRVLVAPKGDATLVVAEVAADADRPTLVAGVERVLHQHRGAGLELAASGVPTVVELVRRHLLADLKLFSAVALLLFGGLVAWIYRDPWIVAGTLAACLLACASTLLALPVLGLSIGMLTANLATLVFVVTLSHIVYLTANWRRLAQRGGNPATLSRQAVRMTLGPSFWCLMAALLGFGSLLLASAKPMRELGLAGSVGALLAFVVAYLVHPVFLARATARRLSATSAPAADPFHGRRLGLAVVLSALVIAALGAGYSRLSTDPGLLSYFRAGGELRNGLEAVDRSGGSSPLALVFTDGAGGRLDDDDALTRLAAAQQALEADPAVGSVLSAAVLLEEARRSPLAAMMGGRQLLDFLAQPGFGNATRGFLDDDRRSGQVLLRMVEAGRTEPRRVVIRRLHQALTREGFQVELTGGLYALQGDLAALVEESVTGGLVGLVACFLVVAFAASRSLRTTFAMTLCLAGTPLALYGTMGWLGLPVDIISSPAANVAIGMGIDSMIHLVAAVRRQRQAGATGWAAWTAARGELARPIVGAAAILGGGFGIFALSSFPPTQRFGLAVLAGIAVATALTLIALPWLASGRGGSAGRGDHGGAEVG